MSKKLKKKLIKEVEKSRTSFIMTTESLYVTDVINIKDFEAFVDGIIEKIKKA